MSLDIDSEYFEFLPSRKHIIMNGNYHHPIKMCHARVLDSSYHELSV
jgi:hypothetical protein